jgi:diguanylate cyclase
MRELADASVEGLLVCDGQTIVSANRSFSQLAGFPAESLVGGTLETCFPDPVARFKLMSRPNDVIETELRHRDGTATPVELIMQPIIFAERPHHVIAVRDLKARKDAEDHIHFLAHHDTLTGLLNRSYFNARVDQEIASLAPGKSLGILCLDLDRFKEINDLFGHATGDKALQTVASRISSVLEDGQMMARLGGDEFAVLMPDITGPAVAGRLAESILEALRSPLGAPDVSIATSIGIALSPDDAMDRQSLLNHADVALYRAKSEGRNTYRFFEAKMGAEVR